MSSKPIPQGSLVLLWAGEDPAVHAALLEELEAAEFRFRTRVLGMMKWRRRLIRCQLIGNRDSDLK